MEDLIIQCTHCDVEFSRPARLHQSNLKRGRLPYCTQSCAVLGQKGKEKVELKCALCQKVFLRNKSDHKESRTGNYYCSLECSKKKKRTKKLKEKRANSHIRLNTSSKKDLFSRRKNWQSARSSISNGARKAYAASGEKKECYVCRYNLHYEIAHIKDVSDFHPEAKISEINAIENLVALCRNHHWEFDNGYLKLSRGGEVVSR